MRYLTTRLSNHLFLLGILTMLAVWAGGCGDNGNTLVEVEAELPVPQRFSASDFEPVENCSCHPNHVREWSGSMHAYAMKDPVFAAIRDVGQGQYINALDQACVQCHSPIGSRSGEIPWGPLDPGSRSAVTREGIGCDLCHTVTSLSKLSNNGLVLTPGPTKYGTTRDPVATPAHESEYSSLYASSEYCGSCHDFVTDDGLELETTFREWRSGGLAVTGKTCNDCHMPAYTGRAAPNAPERTLHRHTFPGVDLALIDFPEKEEQLALVTELLQSALTVETNLPDAVVSGEQYSFEVQLTNDKTGHSVPSGVPFNRQMWLSVIATDASGNIIYSSGQLDANGDLMDSLSAFWERDPDLFNVQATMLRADSLRTGATWDVVYLENPSIKAGETRVASYAFNVPLVTPRPIPATANMTIAIKLRFRSFAPYILRGLALDSLLPVPIIEMFESVDTVLVSY